MSPVDSIHPMSVGFFVTIYIALPLIADLLFVILIPAFKGREITVVLCFTLSYIFINIVIPIMFTISYLQLVRREDDIPYMIASVIFLRTLMIVRMWEGFRFLWGTK